MAKDRDDFSEFFKDGVSRRVNPDTPDEELTERGLKYRSFVRRVSAPLGARPYGTPEEKAIVDADKARFEQSMRTTEKLTVKLKAAGIPMSHELWHTPVSEENLPELLAAVERYSS